MSQFDIVNDNMSPCCVCYENVTLNQNFQNWNCLYKHADPICNKCTSKLLSNRLKCPICRSNINGETDFNIYYDQNIVNNTNNIVVFTNQAYDIYFN